MSGGIWSPPILRISVISVICGRIFFIIRVNSCNSWAFWGEKFGLVRKPQPEGKEQRRGPICADRILFISPGI
jgi:hypothetical protein